MWYEDFIHNTPQHGIAHYISCTWELSMYRSMCLRHLLVNNLLKHLPTYYILGIYIKIYYEHMSFNLFLIYSRYIIWLYFFVPVEEEPPVVDDDNSDFLGLESTYWVLIGMGIVVILLVTIAIGAICATTGKKSESWVLQYSLSALIYTELHCACVFNQLYFSLYVSRLIFYYVLYYIFIVYQVVT